MADSVLHDNDGSTPESKKLLGYDDKIHEDEESEWSEEITTYRKRLIPTPRTIVGWMYLCITLSLTMMLGGLIGYTSRKCSVRECISMTSSYSPLLDVVELYDYQFEAELGTENAYKGHPRPELDALWERIGQIHPISMPAKHLAELNKTTSGIPYSEEQGGGIMVEIEVFHQLHCLNYMRKVIYADYYSRPENRPIEFEVGDDLFYNHIDHCVDYLRQFIMCAGDITPVTSNWVLTHHSPHPDFNTMHKCRNFDKLLEYVEEHDNGGVPKKTPDDTWWPAPKLANTILDYEKDYPIPYHGPFVNDSDKWQKTHPVPP
ncbi:hypothetical protein ST47_g7533 [Ascochyta rabiei]|uniref:Tat pathway signal sequence n=1 Tax=Didymella rabiei TaxID=5454 RepID=A0A163APW1_DIDRA|nr:hypothetical protein ST47_g7533 [Ascochyta rabiei]